MVLFPSIQAASAALVVALAAATSSTQGMSITQPGAISDVLEATPPLNCVLDEVACTITPDMTLDGTDIGTTSQRDPANCCSDCQNKPGCIAFNWYDGVCSLKSTQGKSYPSPGVVSGVITSSAPPEPTTAPACPRIRKSWGALSASEQETFVSALEIAMDRGLYQKFVAIHEEKMSNIQAHGSCVFLFWHRQFLLGFENMLRSLGDRFKCLTLPYWDYVQDYATMQNTPQANRCRSIEACSPITTALGGSTQGSISNANFFGHSFLTNRCVNQRPVNHMCTTAGSASCPKCLPRGDWANTPMISDMSISSVRRSVLSGSNVLAVSQAIEYSPHNIIHSTLNGPMANARISPMDPIFFMHHNTIDLLHTIYYHCRVEPLNLSDSQQKNDMR
ncbi:hypothetical protein DYB32_007610, partial [Aphanomyces invadans]